MPGTNFPGMPIMPGMGGGGGVPQMPGAPQRPGRGGIISAGWYGSPFDEQMAQERYRQEKEGYDRWLRYQMALATARARGGSVGSSHGGGGRGLPGYGDFMPMIMGAMLGGGGGQRGFGDF